MKEYTEVMNLSNDNKNLIKYFFMLKLLSNKSKIQGRDKQNIQNIETNLIHHELINIIKKVNLLSAVEINELSSLFQVNGLKPDIRKLFRNFTNSIKIKIFLKLFRFKIKNMLQRNSIHFVNSAALKELSAKQINNSKVSSFKEILAPEFCENIWNLQKEFLKKNKLMGIKEVNLIRNESFPIKNSNKCDKTKRDKATKETDCQESSTRKENIQKTHLSEHKKSKLSGILVNRISANSSNKSEHVTGSQNSKTKTCKYCEKEMCEKCDDQNSKTKTCKYCEKEMCEKCDDQIKESDKNSIKYAETDGKQAISKKNRQKTNKKNSIFQKSLNSSDYKNSKVSKAKLKIDKSASISSKSQINSGRQKSKVKVCDDCGNKMCEECEKPIPDSDKIQSENWNKRKCGSENKASRKNSIKHQSGMICDDCGERICEECEKPIKVFQKWVCNMKDKNTTSDCDDCAIQVCINYDFDVNVTDIYSHSAFKECNLIKDTNENHCFSRNNSKKVRCYYKKDNKKIQSYLNKDKSKHRSHLNKKSKKHRSTLQKKSSPKVKYYQNQYEQNPSLREQKRTRKNKRTLREQSDQNEFFFQDKKKIGEHQSYSDIIYRNPLCDQNSFQDNMGDEMNSEQNYDLYNNDDKLRFRENGINSYPDPDDEKYYPEKEFFHQYETPCLDDHIYQEQDYSDLYMQAVKDKKKAQNSINKNGYYFINTRILNDPFPRHHLIPFAMRMASSKFCPHKCLHEKP